MAAFTKYNFFVDEVAKAGHNMATAVFKCALTNTAPTPLTDTVWNTTVYPAPAAVGAHCAIASTQPSSDAGPRQHEVARTGAPRNPRRHDERYCQ